MQPELPSVSWVWSDPAHCKAQRAQPQPLVHGDATTALSVGRTEDPGKLQGPHRCFPNTHTQGYRDSGPTS